MRPRVDVLLVLDAASRQVGDGLGEARMGAAQPVDALGADPQQAGTVIYSDQQRGHSGDRTGGL